MTTRSNQSGVEQWMTLSAEQMHIDVERVVSGRVRLRRIIETHTETVQVCVRREVLVIETDVIETDVIETDTAASDTSGVYVGLNPDGPPITGPPITGLPITGTAQTNGPIVIVLREEVPVVRTQVRPYERVTVDVRQRVGSERVTSHVQHETLDLPAATEPRPAPST